MDLQWWIVAGAVAGAAPFLVWGLTRIAAQAWYKTKREHTQRMLHELSEDNDHPN